MKGGGKKGSKKQKTSHLPSQRKDSETAIPMPISALYFFKKSQKKHYNKKKIKNKVASYKNTFYLTFS